MKEEEVKALQAQLRSLSVKRAMEGATKVGGVDAGSVAKQVEGEEDAISASFFGKLKVSAQIAGLLVLMVVLVWLC